MKRAIHIFPAFENERIIEEIRKEFDPLYGFIQPHITLVFPFESEIDSELLKEHVRGAIKGIAPFPLVMRGFVLSHDGFIFLTVKKGNDAIIELHDTLYTGPLEKHLSIHHPYLPHITVGRIQDKEEECKVIQILQSIQETFEVMVTKIVCERIEEDGESDVEFEVG